MGFATGAGSASKSEINVTPLIDVVLVLLIIFLVTMPVMMRQVSVSVPRKVTGPETPDNAVVLTVTYTRDGDFELEKDGEKVPGVDSLNAVTAKLHDILDEFTDKVVFVDFADNTQFKRCMQILDAIKGVGKIVNTKTKQRDVRVAIKTRDTQGR